MNSIKSLIGTRAFYRRVLALTLPIMIQNGITNFVNMLDNVMIGRVGTVEMTGVAVSNLLLFVFNLCIFGAVSGAGIFGAQFSGSGDVKGLRDTFRFKCLFCTGLTVIAAVIFLCGGDSLITLYLRGEGSAADAAASLSYGSEYLRIMLLGLLPYTLVQCYSSTLRETGETVAPMSAGLIAIGVNLCLNYVLIFGHFGAPRLGVAGAAIATVISRFAELAFVAIWTYRHRARHPFIIGAFRSLRVPLSLVRQILIFGMPLMLNETFWSAGISFLNQCYSVRSLDVVAANNISVTFFNVFSVIFMSFGMAIGIIVGQMLGAGETEDARLTCYRLMAFAFVVSVAVAVLYAVAAIWIPRVYNTTDEVRLLATRLMQISACTMPIDAIANTAYFTLRSGGKTFITILFDSCFVWVISVPAAYLLSRYTALPILPLYAIVTGLNLLKAISGIILVRSGIWIRRIVPGKSEA